MAGDPKKSKVDKGKDKKKAARSTKKETFGLFLSLATAFICAVAIKWYVADVYSIPSGSMEPTLFGVEKGGDRVFCFKRSYNFRKEKQPYRFETIVFRYPAQNRAESHYNQNFIKRCVGLPGETVYIRSGDLFVQKGGEVIPKVARKSLALQDSIWIPVYRSDFERNSTAALDYHWARSPEDAGWELAGGGLTGKATGKITLQYKPMVDGYRDTELGISDRHIKRQVVTFACPVEYCDGKLSKTVNSQQLTASCPKCGAFMSEQDIVPESFKNTGLRGDNNGNGAVRYHPLHTVADLRVSCELKPLADKGKFTLALDLEDDTWEVDLGLGSRGRAVLKHNGQPIGKAGEAEVELAQGTRHNLEFFRYDLQLGLRIDGKQVLLFEINKAMPKNDNPHAQSGVTLSLTDGEVEISKLAIDRDIYYYYIPETPEQRMAYFRNLRLPGGQTQAYQLGAKMEEEHCYIVPLKNYLAFGDNAPNSNDSRHWGPVPEANLLGPALFIWWPPHRIRILE
ncbi:MAG: signal peptidase I [Planctomycetes bacterium]|nr:signal peptidase I [Planctomycetota bacterium]